jgi:hypothetical protein
MLKERVQIAYIDLGFILKWQNLQFHNHSSYELTVGTYLDLPLQGLHIVYDFIKHDCLANHLKRETFPNFKSEQQTTLGQQVPDINYEDLLRLPCCNPAQDPAAASSSG